MAEYEKKMRDLLKQHGCYLVRRGKGDHDIWYSPVTGINVTVDGKIKSRHTWLPIRQYPYSAKPQRFR